jgi:PhoH-like ATPase
MAQQEFPELEHGKVKVFVLDTNVLIHRPESIYSFKENEVIIPLWVLEELDKLKTFSDERGRNARRAIRYIDELSNKGQLSQGVKLENGSVLRVALSTEGAMPLDLAADKIDNKIIMTALQLQRQGKRVFFVSKDINARVKATALGIRSVDYEKQKVNIDRLYSGYTVMDASRENFEALRDKGMIPWADAPAPNHFFVLGVKTREGEAHEEPEIGRWDPVAHSLNLVDYRMPAVAGVMPLNFQQRIALELLLDPEVALVSLVGKAGTGKTLLAIAAGMRLTLEDKLYSRVLVSRPVIPMGKDIGYLPGAKDEKLSHWMQPLFDNLEYIMSVYKKQNFKSVDQLVASKLIELEALAYIRGRSFPKQFIIIDEAQNLSPHEVKTIVSRAGDGTKVVLTGDPYQIDSPYLDANSNGLSYLVEAFKGQKIAGHVTLAKSERSRLAELAAELL